MLDLKIKVALFVIALLSANTSYSQCCSAGSPVCASTNVGVLDKSNLRINISHRYSYLEDYFAGNKPDTKNHSLKNTFYNFSNITVGYGLTYRLSLEADLGYYLNKTQNYKANPKYNIPAFQKNGYGFSALALSVKYGLIKKDSSKFNVIVGTGFKMPFSSEPMYDENNTQLPHEIQPSTGAFGLIEQVMLSKGFSEKTRLISLNRFEWNAKNKLDYKYGYFILSSLYVTHKMNKSITGIFEIRSENKSYDFNFIDNKKQINTGSNLLVASPKIAFLIKKKWSLSALLDIPIYKYYQGAQVSSKYSVAVSLTRDFKVKK